MPEPLVLASLAGLGAGALSLLWQARRERRQPHRQRVHGGGEQQEEGGQEAALHRACVMAVARGGRKLERGLAPVPAPAAVVLALTGLPVLGIGGWIRRRRQMA